LGGDWGFVAAGGCWWLLVAAGGWTIGLGYLSSQLFVSYLCDAWQFF
jgi:hypothetical protein